MNSTVTGPVATYLAQVRAELSDLPPGELADVLDDVAGHLTEVAAEFAEPTAAALQERLGTPRQYADELRTAAGYPPRSHPVGNPDQAARRSLRWAVVAGTVGPFFIVAGIFAWSLDASAFLGLLGLGTLLAAAYFGVRALDGHDPRVVLDTPRGAQAAELVRASVEQIPPNVRHELVTIGQPVWWVARGLVGGGFFFALFGAGAVTVVGALAGAAVSIWIGRRTQHDRRWLWYVVPLNIVAAIVVPAWLAASFVGTSDGLFTLSKYDRGAGSATAYPAGLALDGIPVTNLYPFDEQGRPVRVRLYTENGEPLSLPLEDCAAAYGPRESSIEPVSNLYPLPVIEPSAEGTGAESCRDTTKAPFVPPPVPATPIRPTPSASVPPSGSPSVAPSATPSRTPAPVTTPTPSGRPTAGVTLTVAPSR